MSTTDDVTTASRAPTSTPGLGEVSTAHSEDGLDPHPDALRPGGRLGRYVVLGALGAGGMGAVYKVWDPALERAVALKVLLVGRLASKKQLDRFLDEARAIARLDHPALIEVYDIGIVEGCPFFTMEFVDGADLNGLIIDAPMEPVRACRLLATVARGLHEAHQHGIVHRDVKPGNILVDGDDTARLIDFGIARFLEATDERTRTGQVIGTPAYMAPEQAAGDLDAIGPATDVFGLGAALYRAVSGLLPTLAEESVSDAMGVPREVAAICHQAMRRSPGDRYASAAELADDMERFVRGEPVRAALPGPWRRLAWRVRSARLVLVAAAVAALVGVGAWMVTDAWRSHQARQAQAEREKAADLRLTEALAEGRRLRAAADDDAAEAVEREVTLHRDVQETRALARFHLSRAADARARGDRPGALAAGASAYAAAIDDHESFDAMIALGQLFSELRRGPSLTTLLETLVRRFPDQRGQFAILTVDEAVLGGRLAEAAELSRRIDDPRAPLLEALSRGRATDWDDDRLGGRVRGWDNGLADVDGDGAAEVNIGNRLLSVRSADLPDPGLPPIPDGQMPYPIGPGLVAAVAGGKPSRLLALDGDAWTVASPLGGGRLFTYADLDGDGASALYVARAWGLSIYRQNADGTWTETIAHPPTEATSVQPRGLFAADFGPRGRALVMGSSEWKTYDLRVYTPDGQGGLNLAARRKLGAIFDTKPAYRPGQPPLIVAATRPFPGEPQVFPSDKPAGEEPGVHFLEWTDAGLELRDHLPIVSDNDGSVWLDTGDLDGDGRDELIVSPTLWDRRDLLVYRGLPGGWSAPVAMTGLAGLVMADLDGDGDEELVARTQRSGQLIVLGLRDAPPVDVPVWRGTSNVDDVHAPPVADDAAASRAAEAAPRARAIGELVRLGLVDEAIAAWQHQLRLGLAPVTAALEAGRLTELQRRFDEAAELFLQAVELAGDDDDMVIRGLTGAGRTLRTAERWAEERDVLDRLVALLPDGRARADAAARRSQLDAWLAHRIDVERGAELDPRWRIRVPDRIRVEPTGVMEVDTDHIGPIARMPLRPTGGPIGVEIALETPLLQYGGGFMVRLMALSPDGSRRPVAEFISLSWGGGTIVYHRAFAVRLGRAQIVFFNDHNTTTVGRPVHVRLGVDPESGRVTSIGRRAAHYKTHDVQPIAPDERLYVEFGGGDRDIRRGWRTRVRVERLIFDGLRPVDDRWPDLWADMAGEDGEAGPPAFAADGVQAGARALVHGAPTAALDAVKGLEASTAVVIRAAALFDLGRWEEADAVTLGALKGMTPGSPIEGFMRGRLLRDPLHFAPLARQGLGPAADDLLSRTFHSAMDKHRDDPAVAVAARAVLMGTQSDDMEVIAGSAHADQRLRMLLARAQIHRAAGQTGAARADLEQTERLLTHLPPPEGRRAEQRRAAHWARLRRLQAEVHAHAGRFEAAAASMKAALAVAPAPELVADMMIASPALRVMRDRPIWAVIERAAHWADPVAAP